MGIADMFVEFVSSLSFGEVVEAEAPPAEEVEDSSSAGEDTPDEDKSEDAEEEAEEEEEEEEEPEDIMPKLVEVDIDCVQQQVTNQIALIECSNSKACAPAKHHFDDCVERVTRNSEDPEFKGPHEDCVEEFFHLQHCATQCAAPKLWRELK
ncbi:hypothetical protein TRV_04686 [Trichophyton verrucosum HKI 0517]|uniref:Cytochrome b-c1 complex subunit 6, mitochondrial n=1 Tax=Trichophyton verrucosum (strain HKI 0517) TaxID=663202 RepID=D4DC34_TRIVH|nr:uncharacterized protein TRV_04686 [Trichophyton verrucosum HKI 0517]EFE40636.1 hypothetical protein TRV_04686 [Trichophyton verrucosum HKI 0517]